jgi:alcohol dehydrogenase
MLAMIETGQLSPEKLIGRHISLTDAAEALPAMDTFRESGISIIDRFE